MKQILFSCAGTSDPVRGEHDGPMLHILRHYRPTAVYLFLTAEIEQYADADGRFEMTRAWICKHWDGYSPDFHYIRSGIRQAHDLDALDQPLHEAVDALIRENPDAEILFNLSSGTPQMQIILSQLAMDMRYRGRGVQVSNFEDSSGKAQRSNDKQYDVELELECDEDELPGAENSCSEPKMFAIHREYLRRQISALLDARNFDAVEGLKDFLPEDLRCLALHLAARSRLQREEAQRHAGKLLGLPFPLYPFKSGSRAKYSEVCEYYLLMKNLVKSGNCTEFLLHLEPLVLRLQTELLDKLLQREGCALSDFVRQGEDGYPVFWPFLLKAKHPALYAHYHCTVKAEKECDINTYLCNVLLSFYPTLPEKAKGLFAHYAQLKDLRNRLAHSLRAATAAEIRDVCGVDPEVLLDEIEKTIIAAYPVCDPAVFSVYEKSIDYIKAHL